MAYKSITAYIGEVGKTLSGVEGFSVSATATTATLVFMKPSGTTASKTCTVSDTATCAWYYNSTASDFDEAGIYIAQLQVQTGATPTVLKFGTEFSIRVESPISAGATVGGGGWQGGGIAEGDIQDMIDASIGSGSTLSVQDIQDMIDASIAAIPPGGTASLGAWTDVTLSSADFEGDGLCTFTAPTDVDPYHYKMLDADTMIFELSAWDPIVDSGTYTFCGYFKVKVPNGKQPKQYGYYPCLIELPAGTPAQYGSGPYPAWVWADPSENGWLFIYADMNLWASTSSVDAGVFPVDSHAFSMHFSITMQVEDLGS